MPLVGQASLSMKEGAGAVLMAGHNYGSTDLAHGALVARDIAGTDTNTDLQRRRRSHGIALPTSANAHRLWGILQGPSARVTPALNSGEVCTAGLCRALIDVPASTAIAEDTPLVPSITWDATNHVCLFAPALAPVFAAITTPGTNVIVPAANPVAYLREAITSGSARRILAWVDVLPFRRPLPFRNFYCFPGTLVAKTKVLAFEAPGPGAIHRVQAQMLNYGSAAGPTTLDVQIAPKLSTPDQLSIFSTLITMPNDATDGAIFGAGVLNDGDIDLAAFSVGTGGNQGVLKALASRQFPAQSIVTLTTAAVATNAADLQVTIEGEYY